MAIPESEAVAGLKLLVVLAKADGVLSAEERTILAEALTGAGLHVGLTSDELLNGTYDVDALTREVTSQEGRDIAYSACFAMAYAGRSCLEEEQAILDRMSEAWSMPREKRGLIGRILDDARDTAWFRPLDPTVDPQLRDAEVRGDIVKYAVLSAALGLNPVPVLSLATDVAVVGLQAKMFSDIGRHWGRQTTNDTVRQVMAGVGLSTGLRLAANGLMKFIPGAGSVFAASTNFASTWALGQVANQYWESGGRADVQMLREVFQKAQADGRQTYARHAADVEAKRLAHAALIAALDDDYGAGRLSLPEYESAVAELR